MKQYLKAVKWEVILDLKEYARYRMGLVMDFVVFTGMFIAIYYFGVNSGFSSFYHVNEAGGSILMLIGYIFWQNSSAALGYLSSTISGEMERGIFEMRLQSKFSVEGILFCRLLISCIIHVVTYIGILGFCGLVVGYDGRDVVAIFLSILLSFPALVGMYGMGLVFGCVNIIEKSAGSIIFVAQTVLLLITNTLSPSRDMWVNFVPFSCGIEIMRNIYIGENVSPKLVIMYVLVNVIWLLVGCLCFRKALKYERAYGSFDSY
ncbi:hypothetical protein AALB52_19990 [Lachnospiraceae bacterium 38-14]|nr:hypothetical protein [Lachnospiraceae bacterium]